jgi:redox-sensitive bicupin YhaK (pirin superfamily)
VAVLEAGQTVRHALPEGHGAWLHLVAGAATLNGTMLTTGDGAAAERESALEIVATVPSELLLFDLA